MGTTYRLFTHKHDPQGAWVDAKGNRVHILCYDELGETQGSATTNTSAYNSKSVLPHPWLRSTTKATYAAANGFFIDAEAPVPIVYPVDDGAVLVSNSDNFIDTSAGAQPQVMSLSLPCAPINGDVVKIIDSTGTFDNVPVTLSACANTIEGLASATLDMEYGVYEFTWTGTQWVMQREDKEPTMHEMVWDTAAWTSPTYVAGSYAVRKQMWDKSGDPANGELMFYVRMQDYYAGTSDGIVHEISGGTVAAPNLDPQGPALRIFTKRAADAVVEVAIV